MSIIKSIISGFSYQLGKFIFFILIALLIVFLVKGSDIDWESILNRYLLYLHCPLFL